MNYNRQPLDQSLRIIIFSVIGIHAALIILAALTTDFEPKPKPIERLIVKTIQLQPSDHTPTPTKSPSKPAEPIASIEPVEPIEEEIIEEIAAAEPESVPQEPIPEPQPEPIPSKKPEIQKKTPPKKPAVKPKKTLPTKKTPPKTTKKAPPKPVKKPTPKKTEPPKPKIDKQKVEADKKAAADKKAKEDAKKAAEEAQKAKKRALLSSAQKKIAQIDLNHGTISSTNTEITTSVPKQIGALQAEAVIGDDTAKLSNQEVGYYEELASRLKLKLRLPDFGEVKIKLTLERSGHFLKVSIVNAASSKNRQYVEKILPTLTYPGFGKNFSDKTQYTFVIILSNEL